ncbi:MAG: hypothetical protein ACREGI_02990 [Candidatus Levyibacteriota bacterium]
MVVEQSPFVDLGNGIQSLTKRSTEDESLVTITGSGLRWRWEEVHRIPDGALIDFRGLMRVLRRSSATQTPPTVTSPRELAGVK